MGLLAWFQFHIWNPIGTVSACIKAWDPGTHPKPKEAYRSLARYLKAHLSGVLMASHHAVENTRVDILVGSFRKVAVILHHDLDTPEKSQALVAQINVIKHHFHAILVVLYGTHQPDRVEEIKNQGEDLDIEFEVIEK